MGKFNQKLQIKWLLQKNKLFKVLLIKFGRPTMSTRVELSTRKRQRSLYRTPSATLDPVTNSLMKHSMRSSAHSTRMAPEQLRRMRWLFSSNNSSAETETHENQGSHNDDRHS